MRMRQLDSANIGLFVPDAKGRFKYRRSRLFSGRGERFGPEPIVAVALGPTTESSEP